MPALGRDPALEKQKYLRRSFCQSAHRFEQNKILIDVDLGATRTCGAKSDG
jgi:hypothetical protein